MTIAELSSLGGLAVSIITGIVGLYKYINARISRVYERFDEYKKNMEEKFVVKDMCKVLHQNNTENFNKLEQRMEQGFKDTQEQIRDLSNKILDVKR